LFPTKKIKLVQNGYTLAERLKPVQNFSLENLHPVSLLSAFAKGKPCSFKNYRAIFIP